MEHDGNTLYQADIELDPPRTELKGFFETKEGVLWLRDR